MTRGEAELEFHLRRVDRAYAEGLDQLREDEAERYNPHKKGKRKSTKGKHEQGERRRGMDRGGEKGDVSRDAPRVRPKNWKGKWPPREKFL